MACGKRKTRCCAPFVHGFLLKKVEPFGIIFRRVELFKEALPSDNCINPFTDRFAVVGAEAFVRAEVFAKRQVQGFASYIPTL